MKKSLDPQDPSKSVHKDELLLPKKERSHYSDEREAGLLGWVLGGDDHFQRLVEILVDTAPEERRARAWEQACAYAPYGGAHRARIAELLLAAVEPVPQQIEIELWAKGRNDRRAAMCRYRLQNLSARGVWAEDDREDTADAQRVRDRQHRLLEGAFYIARFGAYRCININCGVPLAQDARSGRRHPSHCSPCSATAPWEVGRQREAMRDALDAGTDRRRVRRAKRRASVT